MSKQRRTWYPPEGQPEAVEIFLVNAPLTFGHSQLVVNFDKLEDAPRKEWKRYSYASKFIKRAIRVFKTALPDAARDRPNFGKLSDATLTSGNYVKTLVLRSSASERSNEYKVHLVPFFESHLEQCRLRYHATHGEYKAGGLLSWLGRRETVVDGWMQNDGADFGLRSLDDVAIYLFRLDLLADHLRDARRR